MLPNTMRSMTASVPRHRASESRSRRSAPSVWYPAVATESQLLTMIAGLPHRGNREASTTIGAVTSPVT